MAFLNELHRAWRDRGLLVLAVEAGRNDGPQIAEDLEKMRNIDLVPEFPILPDPRGSICDLFGVRAVPVTYILGKEGRILLRLTEFSDARKPTLEAAVEEAVTGRRPEASQAPAEGSGFPPLLPSSPAGLPEEAPSITRAAKARQEADAGRGEDLEKNRYFADFHYNRGEFDKAEGYYLRVVDIDPRNIEARLRLGDIFIKRKDRVRARQTWEEILRIDPRNAEAADYLRRLNRGDF
jgi:tetratricopeptide (TPR) repeat protein